jgi:hypothetical protein
MDVVEIIIPLVIVAFVFGVFNTVFVAILFFTQRQVRTISKWPSVRGTVLSSRVELRESGEGGVMEHPAVVYSYEVKGETYKGERIAPGPSLSGSGAKQVVARYPAGNQVNVYYNPKDPSDSVLERKATILWVWILLFVVDCILCGVVPVIFWTYGS